MQFRCISLWLYHGILPCPILSAKPTYAISSHNCHQNVSLPSGASLWNGMFGRVESQYTTHGHQPLTSQSIQVRWTRHAEHSWRSKDERMETPVLANQLKLALTSSVRTLNALERIWMREREREGAFIVTWRQLRYITILKNGFLYSWSTGYSNIIQY